MVEGYSPKRVMCQFDLYQRVSVPSPRQIPHHIHEQSRKGRVRDDFIVRQRPYVQEWMDWAHTRTVEEYRPYNHDIHFSYLAWFRPRTLYRLAGTPPDQPDEAAPPANIDDRFDIRLPARIHSAMDTLGAVSASARDMMIRSRSALPIPNDDVYAYCAEVERQVDQILIDFRVLLLPHMTIIPPISVGAGSINEYATNGPSVVIVPLLPHPHFGPTDRSSDEELTPPSWHHTLAQPLDSIMQHPMHSALMTDAPLPTQPTQPSQASHPPPSQPTSLARRWCIRDRQPPSCYTPSEYQDRPQRGRRGQ